MVTWGSLNKEIMEAAAKGGGRVNLDHFRRRYLKALSDHTGRNTLLYSTRWTSAGPPADPDLTAIVPDDIEGFIEVFVGLDRTKGLDLILHSPGGSPAAAEAVVSFIRASFPDFRVLIPHAAMSAATMISCAANEIGLSAHSSLGPIDPQFIMQTELGRMAVPAYAILKQFERAKEECRDPKQMPAWMPMLKQYGPAFLVQCSLAQQLSQTLAGEWLAKWMFAGQNPNPGPGIAEKLAAHDRFLTHARFINREAAAELGLKVFRIEDDPVLYENMMGVYHAVSHTFGHSPAAKIFENHLGGCLIRTFQQVSIQLPIPPKMPGPGTPKPPFGVPGSVPPTPPTPNNK